MPDKFFALAGLVLRPFLDHILHCCVCVGGGEGKGYYVVFICFFISHEKN